MIAVDSSVLIDLLGDGPDADAAEACLRQALASGPVVVCDVVVGEITAGLGHGAEVMDVLEDMGVRYSAVEQRSAIRAGEMQRKYLQRQNASPAQALRTMPDFIVGAHAMLQCSALVTRNHQFFRDYFKGLKLITPH
jgi:predicted nucleic acid-binding protein